MSTLSIILGIVIGFLLSAVGYFLYVKFIEGRELTEDDFDEIQKLDDDFFIDADDALDLEFNDKDIEIEDDDEVAEKIAKEVLVDAKNEVTKPKPSRYARRYRQDKD